jgi:Spy/CpxP family protein refolding chaperone
MRRIHAAGLALALTLGAASAASAQQPAAPRAERSWGGRGPGGEKMFKDLNLTSAQKSQVKAIHAKYEGQEKSLREQMKPAREQMQAARKSGDTAKLESVRAQYKPQMEQARALRERQMAEVRGILTPDQQAKLDAKIAQFRANAGKRGQHGR